MRDTPAKRIGDLQLHENLAHQRREWVFQRVGWAAMALAVALALAGLLGHGPLSDRRVAAGPVSVEYHRFERYEAPSQYRIAVDPALTGSGRLMLRVERPLLDRVDIERIEPEPLAVQSEADALLYAFAVEAGRPAEVRMAFRPRRFGTMPVNFEVGGAPVAFNQFVYP